MSGLTYELNEVVMCKSSPTDAFGYPAKIIEVDDTTPGKKRYQIHYKGWNNRYDIWVEEGEEVDNMLFKHTAEVEAEHKKLLDESKGKTPKQKKAAEASASTAKKRKLEREGSADSSQESGGHRTMPASGSEDATVVIPDKLRAVLLDDNDMINRQQRLAKLPAAVTIDMIIKEYSDALSADGSIEDVAGNDEMLVEYKDERQRMGSKKEVVLNKHDMVQSSLGVIDYFNILLGSQLLYARERTQYSQSCVNPPANAPGTKVNPRKTPELEELKIVPSSIYGLGHLVRLFVRIGPLLATGNYGDKSLQTIIKHITDFLIFISKNLPKFYNIERDYEVGPKNTTDVSI